MEIIGELYWLAFMSFMVGFAAYQIYDIKGSSYRIHKKMTIHFCQEFGKGTFKQFLREFKEIKWERSIHMPDCFSNTDSQSRILDDVVMFNGKGMVFSSARQHRKFKRYMEKIIIEGKEPNYDWTEQSKPLLETSKPIALKQASGQAIKASDQNPSLN